MVIHLVAKLAVCLVTERVKFGFKWTLMNLGFP